MALTRETPAIRIRNALEERGMAQAELAAAIGMEPSALSKALASKRNLGSLEVALIAQRLSVPTDRLLADEDRLPRTTALAAPVTASANSAVGRAVEQADQMSELDHLLTEMGHGGDDPLPLPPLPLPPLPDVPAPFD